MRGQKSIFELSDRELRAVKRALRQRRSHRRRVFASAAVMLAVACLIIGCSLYYSSVRSRAGNGFKYYTSVTVEYGETLWNLADAYIDYGYQDKNGYINEVCSINHLDEDGAILAGQTLVVPYYSEEYVK